jgi:hypothetical protein
VPPEDGRLTSETYTGSRHNKVIVKVKVYKEPVVPQLSTSQKLQCTQLTQKTASVVHPEDGRLTPETCGGLRHNKVILKVKVY